MAPPVGERALRGPVAAVRPTPDEVRRALPGDDLVPAADVVMDRAFDLPAAPEVVWPWFVQLGRRRGGWYLPRRLEGWLPEAGRGLRHLEPGLLGLRVGDVIPDWPRDADTFEVAAMDPPRSLVHRSQRGRTAVSWAIVLDPAGPATTRVQLRLRLSPIRRRWIAGTLGEALDLLTVAGLAVGLRERLA